MLDEATRLRYLDAMGIRLWVPRKEPGRLSPALLEEEHEEVAAAISPEPQFSMNAAAGTEEAGRGAPEQEQPVDHWQELKAEVAACRACPLHHSRTQTVFGVGCHHASWMIVGEAPGASEDQQGEPFVGPAGRLLTEMLRAIGLSREEVFITNILKCRPPNNRDPKPGEVDVCETFLERQIALVKPQIILAVGRIAAQNLLKTDTPIGRLRGKAHRYRGIPVVVVYHPAYLLRSLAEKRKAWEDLLFACALMGRSPLIKE